MVPLLSKVWIVWVTLFSKIQKLEDITIWKSENRGQKNLLGLETTLERNGRWLSGAAEQRLTLSHNNNKNTCH